VLKSIGGSSRSVIKRIGRASVRNKRVTEGYGDIIDNVVVIDE
jgi:hypothetical protein